MRELFFAKVRVIVIGPGRVIRQTDKQTDRHDLLAEVPMIVIGPGRVILTGLLLID